MQRSVTITAAGEMYRIDLSSLDDRVVSVARDIWSDAVPSAPSEAGVRGVIVADGTLPQSEMLSDLSQRVTLAAIEGSRGRRWTIHAAGLAADDGRVIVLVGPSGRGKTTASRALGARFGYVTDETVAIDMDGTVHPYRKPLSLIEDGIRHPKVQRAPHTLGLRHLPDKPLTLGAIVLLSRDPDGPDQPSVERVDLADAFPELLAQTSHLTDLSRPLHTVVAHASRVGGVHRVTYREAETLLDVLEQLIRKDHPPRPTGATNPIISCALPRSGRERGEVTEPSTRSERFTRTHVADAVHLDDPDRLLLLHIDGAGRGTVRMLTGLGPEIWLAAQGATVRELTDAVVRVYGREPGIDVHASIVAAVKEMRDQGLLAVDGPI